ncbi:MAG TPA: YceI family protein [Gemmatimonadaceae bacterium]|nr:YceI family protein [Gemmatimonadaceae bacterium]
MRPDERVVHHRGAAARSRRRGRRAIPRGGSRRQSSTAKRFDGSPPKADGDRFQVVGDLVMRDGTMEVVLDGEYLGRRTDQWGKTRAGFSFRTELDRREWGLKWNQALETGGVLVANLVRVAGEVQFVRQDG